MKAWSIVLALVGFWAMQSTVTVAQFTDVTSQSGISYTQNHPTFMGPHVMSGGAAAGDFDRDGFIDLFVTRMDNTSILYRNQGDGTFADVSSSVSGISSISQGNGASWGDIDNDGDLDLYVTSIGHPGGGSSRNYLLVNNGQWGQGTGGFQEVAIQRNVDLTATGEANRFSSTFGDYDGDGYLDLQTTAWSDVNGTSTRLFRNAGASNPGQFSDVTVSAGVEMTTAYFAPISYAFSPRFSDLNNDGHPDLAITGDFGTSRLFWNNGDGTFTDGTVAAGVGTDENGMGSAIADFNHDGNLDWFVSSIDDPGPAPLWGTTGNRLFTNNGDETFTDTTTSAGVRDGGWGWGSSAFDYDNDGHLDIVMTNGFPTPPNQNQTDFREDQMRLFRNNGDGTFDEVATLAGLTDTGEGKGLLTMDYDADGDLDIYVVNNAGEPILYRNDLANDNDWLQVAIDGFGANADGIGARIELTSVLNGLTQLREINAGSNFLGQDDSLAHFGLGDLEEALIDELKILMPKNDGSGTYDEFLFHDLAPNQRVTFNQQTGQLVFAVPEPTSFLLLGSMAFGAGAVGRRRRNYR